MEDPQQPELPKYMKSTQSLVEQLLMSLDQLPRAQFAYDDAVDVELQ